MLKLEYILIGKLPKTERDMLLENLRTERECGRNVLEWDSAKPAFMSISFISESGSSRAMAKAIAVGLLGL